MKALIVIAVLVVCFALFWGTSYYGHPTNDSEIQIEEPEVIKPFGWTIQDTHGVFAGQLVPLENND